jgi:hypothetical protein
MAKVWLDERLKTLLPALAALDASQEDEIERLCLAELEAWRARPGMTKENSLRPVVTAARNAIRRGIKLTAANRYLNEQRGEYQHIALKYLNLDWDALNVVSDEKFEAGLRNQQEIVSPHAVVIRAEHLLHSNRSDELVVGLALVTGRRLTELLKSGRFFPSSSAWTVIFDGQLKRRDLAVEPYEIPVLVDAEQVMQAWRRLRMQEDCTGLDIEAVAQRYSRVVSECANRHFTGLIPQRKEHENLYTHAFRAVYAQIAVHWFCPKYIDELVYANSILGHFQANTESKRRDYLATMHYHHYYIDGGKGVRLGESGIVALEAFQRKGEQAMTDMVQTEMMEVEPVLETKKHKTRGTLTVKPGTYDLAIRLIEQRGMQGTGGHDRLLVDLIEHDTVAHQMYALLQPVADELHTSGPLATLRALIDAYHAGGSGAAAPTGTAELLREVGGDVEYLRGLVERDRNFKAAIIAHNERQTDLLHLWYINAAVVRDLVGGRNDAVQSYLETRKEEIEAHHKKYGLTPRQNRKPIAIESQITVQ